MKPVVKRLIIMGLVIVWMTFWAVGTYYFFKPEDVSKVGSIVLAILFGGICVSGVAGMALVLVVSFFVWLVGWVAYGDGTRFFDMG